MKEYKLHSYAFLAGNEGIARRNTWWTCYSVDDGDIMHMRRL